MINPGTFSKLEKGERPSQSRARTSDGSSDHHSEARWEYQPEDAVNARLPPLSKHKQILESFHPEFGEHSPHTTTLVDYWSFHEAKENWFQGQGNGTLLSASHMEVERLWSQVERVDVYEAFLVRFVKKGGEVTRIFVLDRKALSNEPVRRLLASVVLRHKLLGFKTLVTSVVDLSSVSHLHQVRCDMFAVINNVVALFFKYPPRGYKLMARTTEKSFVENATKAFSELFGNSSDADFWYREESFELSKEEKKKVETDCGKITAMARYWGRVTD